MACGKSEQNGPKTDQRNQYGSRFVHDFNSLLKQNNQICWDKEEWAGSDPFSTRNIRSAKPFCAWLELRTKAANNSNANNKILFCMIAPFSDGLGFRLLQPGRKLSND